MRARSLNIAPTLELFDDLDRAALAARVELDRSVAQREDRVVATDARTGPGAELRAALAHDDRACGHLLAGEHLHAEHLGVRVASVARRAKTLLVRHLAVLLGGERRLDRGKRALALAVPLLVRKRGLELR